MKTKLWTATALAVACSAVLAAALNLDELAKAHVKAMRDDGSITNVVNLIVSDGTFCQVRGHKWEFGCGVNGCLVNHYAPMRHCAVCGSTQTQKVGPWQ